jgi:hypothetical protein
MQRAATGACCAVKLLSGFILLHAVQLMVGCATAAAAARIIKSC